MYNRNKNNFDLMKYFILCLLAMVNGSEQLIASIHYQAPIAGYYIAF